MAHTAVSGKDPSGVDLDSEGRLVDKGINLNFGDVIKDSRRTMIPPRTRGGLNISDNSRPSKFKDTVVSNIVDVIDGRVGPT